MPTISAEQLDALRSIANDLTMLSYFEALATHDAVIPITFYEGTDLLRSCAPQYLWEKRHELLENFQKILQNMPPSYSVADTDPVF